MPSPDASTLCETTIRRDFVPASDYTPAFHRLEMERLWPRVWQIACREEEIPNVGDYVNYQIGNESILVVRDAPDSIRALYNVCPHRGRRMRDDERGNVRSFFCGYHAWTFGLDGKITYIPSEQDWNGCPAMSSQDLSMVPVKCDRWAGFVWINMDSDSESLQQFLAPLPEKLNGFDWDKCRIRSYQTLIFPVNWKVALEAFVEAYHVRATHPQLYRFGDMFSPGLEQYLGAGQRHGAHTGHYIYEFDKDSEWDDPRQYVHDHIMEIHDTLHGLFHDAGARAAKRILTEVPEGTAKEECYARFAQFLKEEVVKSGADYPEHMNFEATEWQVFPNSSILPCAEGAFWYRSRPNGDDPNSTIFDVWSLGRYAPGQAPKWTHEFYESPAAFKGKNPILEQDFSNLIAVQKGMHSRGWKAARPSPIQESNISNIHRVLHEFMSGGDGK